MKKLHYQGCFVTRMHTISFIPRIHFRYYTPPDVPNIMIFLLWLKWRIAFIWGERLWR